LNEIWDDCCDFCVKVDDTKCEVEVCTKMVARCRGDSCSTCKVCKDFAPSLEFTSTLALARRRMRPITHQSLSVNQGRSS
jgi:hypothetical protein